MLMVVAETTRSHRAGVSPQSGADARTGSTLTSTLAPLAFSFLLAFSCLTPAKAAIVADNHAPGGQQPQIANSANGTPQVNIQTPSGAGVSRNVYSQFDVDGRGVVLNNSHANTSTQLAGMVAGNPNLAKGEARVILNEVNTRDPSRLNGYIEVAGQKAQVVIANPAGISCDGCGFINANRATLTTGQVQYGNGQISGYDVNRGEIIVQGGGLDASSVDSTDLLARAVKINAGVWAQELKVTAGRNQIDAAHSRTTAKSADGSALPAVAIDVSALGGMYAHKIRLVGTERGVGVHNAGNIGAAAGDVAISADGALSNSGVIQSAQNLQLSVKGDLHNQGQLYAGKDSVVTASATGKVNVEANAMSHAVWGAIAAASGNNSALAGAAGAVSGELLGRWIAAEYYPDVKTEELSDEQKSTISALSTLAAGLMGGLSGGSSADAVAGAQAGKNAVENNLMGGNEWSQGEKAREHGADVLSCADNPSGEACQRGIAENKAYAGALASAGLIYLPGGIQITGAIGGTANAGVQYLMNGEVNPTDVLIATYVGAFTRNTGLKGTMSWNAAGGATSSYLKGDNPFTGGLINGLASGVGYGAGKLIELPMDKIYNPMKPWKDWMWTDVGMGISKPLPINPLPGTFGNGGASLATEVINSQAGKVDTNKLMGNKQ